MQYVAAGVLLQPKIRMGLTYIRLISRGQRGRIKEPFRHRGLSRHMALYL